MDAIMSVVSIAVTIVLVLMGVMFNSWRNEMKELKAALKNGLATKVDGVEYQLKQKWQESDYGDLKITIKELIAANDKMHTAIMFEIKRTNDIMKNRDHE